MVFPSFILFASFILILYTKKFSDLFFILYDVEQRREYGENNPFSYMNYWRNKQYVHIYRRYFISEQYADIPYWGVHKRLRLSNSPKQKLILLNILIWSFAVSALIMSFIVLLVV